MAPTLLIVAMLACVLVPLPTPLVDLLLSVSLAGSVLLLVAGLGIRRTTDFLNFPSMLLLATLFRLALNISTTRLILSEADAGRVIEAFSSFVVRDDLIVGGVMFAIITIVQYVVIARGAERVAEVGARFALDGLPGHQAAIDADLRAGVISAQEASSRRAALAERSGFYGAMDGAVRFVKGDAIAGLAITAVNLIGGLAIGMGRDGLPWDETLQTYARLTVGDGLLAQIPAVLVSLAAGVLVSRVDARRGGPPRPALQWLDPAMLFIPAVLLVVLAAVPAMPSLAFITTAVALVTIAVALSLRAAGRAPLRPRASAQRRISVELAPSAAEPRSELERTLAEVRASCATALGIEIPPIDVVPVAGRESTEVQIIVDERRCSRVLLDPAQSFGDQLVLTSFRAVMDNAAELVDLEELDRMVDEVRSSHPVVAARALEAVELQDVLLVVRAFLRERIKLPPMRALLGALAEGRRFRDPLERPSFGEMARTRLVSHWIHGELEGLRRLGNPRFVRLTPDAEEELRARLVLAEDEQRLGLGRSERAAWQAAIVAAAAEDTDAPTGDGPIVLVATPSCRQAAALLVAGMIPRMPVLSTEELHAGRESAAPVWVDVP